jgi:CDP-paratose 2-epimerase
MVAIVSSLGSQAACLITGGAGFIGTNLAHQLASEGKKVIIYDNLSRAGTEHNLSWLKKMHGDNVFAEIGDIRHSGLLERAVARADEVYHFAAQVAVTTSLEDPVEDFEINARGTLNLLEAIRKRPNPPSLLYTSSNKVLGRLEHLEFFQSTTRYEPVDPLVRDYGVSEEEPLHFCSPYGCSKGSAEQYVLDYVRTFNIPAAVFRMSCIYGPHQFGTEDQGWVAHFMIRALERRKITVYGDGKQVRDVLFVNDLLEALRLAQRNMHRIAGEVFHIGGGPSNTASLLELLEECRYLSGQRSEVDFSEWRMADQKYYVSDNRKFQGATGWTPATAPREGFKLLYQWLLENRPLPQELDRVAMEGLHAAS